MLTYKKSIAHAYGEIYFNAWKNASGAFLIKLENGCLQDLIYHAIFVSDKALLNSLREILDYFNSQRKYKGVDKMLLRLYEPLLWRNLKVTNSQVRLNALSLFINAFPLQDSDASNVEMSNLLQRQFNELNELLFDGEALVRELCVKGVSKILNIYWELIPTAVIKLLLSKMIDQLAYDSNSVKVRVAVVNGLTYILNNFLSHSLFKQLLPSSSPLFHDKSDSVRIAYCKLLIAVKSVKNIHFLEIVKLEDLLMRLEHDMKKPKIASLLSKLLLSSFFPQKKLDNTQLKRFKQLYEANQEACFSFYSNLFRFVSLEGICTFIRLQLKYIQKAYDNNFYQQQEDQQDLSSSNSSSLLQLENSENNQNLSNNLLPSKNKSNRLHLVIAMIKNIRILWQSIDDQLLLQENKQLRLVIFSLFNLF